MRKFCLNCLWMFTYRCTCIRGFSFVCLGFLVDSSLIPYNFLDIISVFHLPSVLSPFPFIIRAPPPISLSDPYSLLFHSPPPPPSVIPFPLLVSEVTPGCVLTSGYLELGVSDEKEPVSCGSCYLNMYGLFWVHLYLQSGFHPSLQLHSIS